MFFEKLSRNTEMYKIKSEVLSTPQFYSWVYRCIYTRELKTYVYIKLVYECSLWHYSY